jgi:excisionase family DNA binding protein
MTLATAPEPLAYRPRVAAEIIGVSRSQLYNLIAAGEIKAHKSGTATLILRAEIERYVAGLPLKGDDAPPAA